MKSGQRFVADQDGINLSLSVSTCPEGVRMLRNIEDIRLTRLYKLTDIFRVAGIYYLITGINLHLQTSSIMMMEIMV